jgi:hypothetical protein
MFCTGVFSCFWNNSTIPGDFQAVRALKIWLPTVFFARNVLQWEANEKPGSVSMKAIFIQAIGIFGTILFFLSYQCRSNRKLFRVQFVSYLCYTTHLLMLGAVTGGVSYILNTLRSFCLGSRYAFLKGKAMCMIICILQLVTLILTWDGWWSILPVAANIAATIGGYTYNGQRIRAVGIFINSPLWILYDILVGSWAGVLDEVVTEASMLLSIYRYGWKNLDVTEL